MKIAEMRDFINRQKWIFAKTYAERAPHEYMLKKNINGTEEEMLAFCKDIREKGMTMKFWNHENKYIYVDGRYYWFMDATPEECILINRCEAADYDYIIQKKGA